MPSASQSAVSSQQAALMVELAKCLKLVAPVSMSAEAQAVWLRAAADTLEGIRAIEVAEISVELRRKVTRHSQIVHEISELVDAARKRRNRTTAKPASPFSAEREIHDKADAMRAVAMKCQDKSERNRRLSDAFEFERQAKIDAGIAVPEYPKRLNREELDAMPAHIRTMGLNAGFLTYRNGELIEA